MTGDLDRLALAFDSPMLDGVVPGLPPIEYRDMPTARKKGWLSIEAWTPTPEKRHDLWFAYQWARLSNK